MKELQFQINDTILTHSPDGWDSTMLEIDRSPKFLGIVRSFTVQLKFVLEGAEMLRSIFYNRLQCETKLTIRKLHPITLQYETVYTGVFDFSSFVDSDYNVTITVTDLTLSYLIKKNIDTTYTTIFLTNYHIYTMGEFGPINPIDAISFSTFFELIFDTVTEGRYQNGEFGLDLSELTTLENGLSTVYLTNAVGLIGARFDRIEISFADFLKNIFIFFKLVISIEIVEGKETLKLRPLSESFPETAFANIAHVSGFKVSVAKDFIYDSVAAGFPEQDYDQDTDSSNEIGTTTTFSQKNAFVGSNPLELVTDFRGDTIGINYWMAIYGGTMDNLDYTPFVLHVEKNIVYNKHIAELGYVGTTNPPTNKVSFNTEISPKRLYKSHERFINSCFFGPVNTTEVINSKLNISNLYSQPHNYDQVEAECEGITRTANPYFAPVYFELDGVLPLNLEIASLYNPENSKLSFEYKGETYNGFIMNIKTNIYGKRKATIKLLAAPDNDLSKLIR